MLNYRSFVVCYAKFLIIKVSFLNACFFCQTEFVVTRCVGAKANVLHWVGFERGDAALLILLKHWHFVFHFFVCFLSLVSSFLGLHTTLRGLALGQVSEH